MTKILHTADWQIGRLYGTFDPDDAAALAEARFVAVERLAALAASEAVDAVVVAGDVFDAQTVSARSIRKLFNAMAGYGGPWVMIPGNHDAALAESVWTHAARLGALPSHLHLALEPRVVTLPGPRIALLCAPLTQRHTFGDLTAWFDTATTPPGWLRIGVAHGAVQGVLADDIDSANPIAPNRAALARLDYLALGDWHGSKCIDARTWYSGTPEQDRFKSNDAGQALLVQLGPAGAAPLVFGEPVKEPETIATAIRIGSPASWTSAVEAQQQSKGRFIAATDEEILAAYHLVARAEGVFVEPASAASIAGLLKSVEDGWVRPGSTVVCTVTGNGLKDPDTALKGMPTVTPVPVDPIAVVAKLGLV